MVSNLNSPYIMKILYSFISFLVTGLSIFRFNQSSFITNYFSSRGLVAAQKL